MYGDGWTPLMACCVAGHLDIARVLLRWAGPHARNLVLSANRYGLTAGHIAARRGDLELLLLLLTIAGGNLSKVRCSKLQANLPGPPCRHDPSCSDVHLSALSCNLQGCAIQRAQVQRLLLIVNYLGLRYVCSLQAKDSNGETPITVAVRYKHVRAVQLLTESLMWPKVPVGRTRNLPLPYSMEMQLSSKRRSLNRPAYHRVSS